MPLKEGASKAAFKWNVRELVKSGRKIKQALAISFAKRREARGEKKQLP